jgi:RHS repeat-associated protein
VKYAGTTISTYRLPDWLGSLRVGSNPNRTYSWGVAFAPFGERYAASGGPAFSFTGQNEDTAAGLYDFLFREYHATQGRWISPDPAGMAAVSMASPQTWNRYGYLGGRPLNAVDPEGLLGRYGDCIGCNPYMHPAGDKGFGQMWGVVIEASFGPIGVSFSYGYSGAVATGPINSLFDEELPVNLTPPPLIPNNIQQVLNFVLFRQPVDWGSFMGGSACNPICDAQKAPANNGPHPIPSHQPTITPQQTCYGGSSLTDKTVRFFSLLRLPETWHECVVGGGSKVIFFGAAKAGAKAAGGEASLAAPVIGTAGKTLGLAGTGAMIVATMADIDCQIGPVEPYTEK